jgi:hypothetical protein
MCFWLSRGFSKAFFFKGLSSFTELVQRPVFYASTQKLFLVHRDGACKIGETISHGNDYLGDAKVVIADK